MIVNKLAMNIKVFNFDHYLQRSSRPYPTILVSGGSSCELDRAFIAHDICRRFKDYEKVVCMGKSPDCNRWKDTYPTARCSTFDPEFLGNIVNERIAKFRRVVDMTKCGRLLIVLFLDESFKGGYDCCSRGKDILKKICAIGRHNKITLVLVTQCLEDLGPHLRRQVNILFMLHNKTDDEGLDTNTLKLLKNNFFCGEGVDNTALQKLTNEIFSEELRCMVKIPGQYKSDDTVFTFKAAVYDCVEDCLVAARRNGLNLQFVSERFKNHFQTCLAAVQQNGWALGIVSDHLKENFELCVAAVTENGWVMEWHVPESLINDTQFCLRVCIQNKSIIIPFQMKQQILQDRLVYAKLALGGAQVGAEYALPDEMVEAVCKYLCPTQNIKGTDTMGWRFKMSHEDVVEMFFNLCCEQRDFLWD